jgi:hypothetical protein
VRKGFWIDRAGKLSLGRILVSGRSGKVAWQHSVQRGVSTAISVLLLRLFANGVADKVRPADALTAPERLNLKPRWRGSNWQNSNRTATFLMTR